MEQGSGVCDVRERDTNEGHSSPFVFLYVFQIFIPGASSIQDSFYYTEEEEEERRLCAAILFHFFSCQSLVRHQDRNFAKWSSPKQNSSLHVNVKNGKKK